MIIFFSLIILFFRSSLTSIDMVVPERHDVAHSRLARI
jgi:hypothetical protein